MVRSGAVEKVKDAANVLVPADQAAAARKLVGVVEEELQMHPRESGQRWRCVRHLQIHYKRYEITTRDQQIDVGSSTFSEVLAGRLVRGQVKLT